MKIRWIWKRRKELLVWSPYVILLFNILGFTLTGAYNLEDEVERVMSRIDRRSSGTEITPDPVKTLLLASTLDGSLTAVGRLSGRVRWVSKDEPMIRVPTGGQSNSLKPPHFLPDPRSGSLYLLGGKGQLKKLPFTIPQLVSMAPCRSSEGLLYTGRKMDLWLSLDPLTGQKEEIFSFADSTCPAGPSDDTDDPVSTSSPKEKAQAVLLGKSEYTISMADGPKKWNVTFHDYSSIDMAPQHVLDYELVHFTSPSTGTLLTYDKSSGELLWQTDLSSPIIALYSIDTTLNSLISVPFTSVAAETLERINSPEGSKDNSKLLPTLYVGECPFGLYAVSSLVDDSVRTISDTILGLPRLEGPAESYGADTPIGETWHPSENHSDPGDVVLPDFLILGHYAVPETTALPPVKQITASPDENIPIPIPPLANGSDSVIIPVHHKVDPVPFETSPQHDGKETHSSRPIQTFPPTPVKKPIEPPSTRNWFPPPPHAKSEKEKPFIILTTAAITIAVMTTISTLGFFTVRKFHWKRHPYPTYLSGSNGIVTVGKINFDTTSVLGKGCEGTFVYKGKFEGRDIAVKRILPECFEFADREVDLLKESDQHPNVIRYFCTETDGQFRYIALELCSATLSDWIEGKFVHGGVQPMDVLKEATDGLEYLHSLHIVHRDIKPANVLLSVCANTNGIRTMISDFGLCKKLTTGRVSFSRRSGGIPGTEGWIAPEMLKNSGRTTRAVDVFSLGCVYYYVLSDGEHPFGDAFRRQSNISMGQHALGHDRVAECPQGAQELIQKMLSFDSASRPPLSAVRAHPMFWAPDKILAFFLDVSDRVEKEEESTCVVLRRLENEAHCVIRGDWRDWICDEVKNDLRKYRTYRGNSVRDLLRALRNKKNHYRELTEAAQQSLGHIPDQFVSYWITRFPNLLSYTWRKFEPLRDEPVFGRYYPKNYIWTSPDEESEDLGEILNAVTDDNWRAPSNGSTSAEGDPITGQGFPPDGVRIRQKQDNKQFWRPKSQYNKYNPRWRKPPREGGEPPLTFSPSRQPRLPTIDDNNGPWRSSTPVTPAQS